MNIRGPRLGEGVLGRGGVVWRGFASAGSGKREFVWSGEKGVAL